MTTELNTLFWGTQTLEGVKILQRLKDWLRPYLQGATEVFTPTEGFFGAFSSVVIQMPV